MGMEGCEKEGACPAPFIVIEIKEIVDCAVNAGVQTCCTPRLD